MARKSSPPSPLTPEEFSGMLAAHRRWLRSEGKEGQEADLSGANLAGLDLDGYDLSYLDFREANLARVRFGDAHVEGTSFRAADLQEADLRGAQGLLAPQLAGADLAGARLPEDLQEFAGLKHVDAASGHVQRIFFLLLSVCLYCWFTIAITTDAGLLNNFAETPLPIINTKINLVMFYWAAPFLLLCVYLYFHLCLQRLWEALAELPGVFPDGLPLPQRVHPWLWNGLVWAYFPRLRDRRPPLLGLQKFLAILLVWWAGPLTLLALWWRYLPSHDWTITAFHLVLLTLALDGALGFSLLTWATLRLKEGQLSLSGRGGRKRIVKLLWTTAGIAALFSTLSLAAIEGLERLSLERSQSAIELLKRLKGLREADAALKPPQIVIELFERLIYGRPWVHADLREADVSLKPPQWRPGDLDQVRGAFLRERNLRGADAYKAFLAKADLSDANLQQARLWLANLQQAYLRGANLQQANLEEANLQQAILGAANLQQANLEEANLQKADLGAAKLQKAYLRKADLQQANLWKADLQQANLYNANLQQAKLSEANLQKAKLWGANLQQANLGGADLQQANLWGANLQQANLGGANLQKADLNEANLLNANLRGANLQQAYLDKANLQQANLEEANLQQANLLYADLREGKGLVKDQVRSASSWPLAKYSQQLLKVLKLPPQHNGNLDKKNLSRYQLPYADLRGAYLYEFNLRGANLRGADLQYAHLVGADLQQANLSWAILRQAYLNRAKLKQAYLGGAELQQAYLQGADFREAQGLEKDQVRAARCWPLAKYSQEMLKVLELPPEHIQNLDNDNLSQYQLPRADLGGALLGGFNLRGANLQGANLDWANFSEADLTGTDLRGANFKGADLQEAKGLTREQVKSAIMDEHTQLPDDLKDLVPSGSKKP